MVATIDASDELEALAEREPALFNIACNMPNARISEADGMFGNRNAGYYFMCGLDAARLCVSALDRNGISQQEVGSVLDYACGFGRVGRALQACFPQAKMLGVDVDAKAIEHYQSILGIETTQISKEVDGAGAIHGSFDLIWVGSLFTHIPEHHLDALLRDLGALLSDRGVLAFTLHGDYVVGRLESGIEYLGEVLKVVQRDYGLDSTGIREVVTGFRQCGFGFSPYPNAIAYGISATSRAMIEERIQTSSLRLLMHQDRGWVKHQDFCAASRT